MCGVEVKVQHSCSNSRAYKLTRGELYYRRSRPVLGRQDTIYILFRNDHNDTVAFHDSSGSSVVRSYSRLASKGPGYYTLLDGESVLWDVPTISYCMRAEDELVQLVENIPLCLTCKAPTFFESLPRSTKPIWAHHPLLTLAMQPGMSKNGKK